ncbi:hypothetical protein F5Y16DRAFT_102526 [Xylariaceae sp. FL0255]|nr:hypothetical protein F5Y16DRAFT_102526 [Xylariaceae sp. FL0255]
MDRMKRAIQTVLSDDASRRYFILVDGLDELDGTEEKAKTKQTQETIDLFISLAKLPQVKICVSSRPWLIFEDAFEEKSSLTMEYLTRSDITAYVRDRFESNKHFAKLEKQEPVFASQLVMNIVDKSAGVFLWVYIVSKSLLTGLSNSDGISDLQTRLDELPEELEALFERMLLSLDPFYRAHASRLFLITEAYGHISSNSDDRGTHPLSLLSLFFAGNENPMSGIEAPICTLSFEDKRGRQETMRRRLNARCRGLLEATEPTGDQSDTSRNQSPSHQVSESNVVHYLHRTATDYILRPETWNQILASAGSSFDPYRCVANSFLIRRKITNISNMDQNDFIKVVFMCCDALSRMEPRHQDFIVEYLDEMDSAGNSIVKEALAQKVPLKIVREDNLKQMNWIGLYTTHPVASLVDYAVWNPPDFVSLHTRQGLFAYEHMAVSHLLTSYAVLKIRVMNLLDGATAARWLERSNNEEVTQAIEAACPNIIDLLRQMEEEKEAITKKHEKNHR